MTITLPAHMTATVRDALARAGARAANRVTDDTMRADTRARLAVLTRDDRHAHTLYRSDVPQSYTDAIAAAHSAARDLKAMCAEWRAYVTGTPGDNTHDATEGIGFVPSDERSRTLATAISAARKAVTAAYAIPLHHSDMYAWTGNRFLKSIHYHSHAIEWAGIDPEDILQSAYAACLSQGNLTVGAMYRAVKQAARNERAFAFATRGGGMVSIDALDEYQTAHAVTLDRLRTYGRAVVETAEYGANTPDALAFDPTVSQVTDIQAHRDAIMDAARDEQDRREAAERMVDERRDIVRERATDDAMGVATLALLVEGNTLADIAEYLGVTVPTVTGYALRMAPEVHPIGREHQAVPTFHRSSVVTAA